MKKWIKSVIVSTAMLATCLAPLSEAFAGGRHHGGPYYGGGNYHHGGGYRPQQHHHHHYHEAKRRSHRRDAVAAGIIGLGVGAIIGSALARPSAPPPPPRAVYPAPQPVYSGLEPWSPSWYRYCEQRYRSFNPNTGTFRGFDGQDHFCVAN